MINVVMISVRDYADSGKRILEALSFQEGISTNYICLHKKGDHFPPKWRRYSINREDVCSIESADVVIFKGDEMPSVSESGEITMVEKKSAYEDRRIIKYRVPARVGKNAKKILIAGGSGFRRKVPPMDSSIIDEEGFEWFDIDEYYRNVDKILTTSPDIAYKVYGAEHLGFAINSSMHLSSWVERSTIVISCYQIPKGRRDRKGVNTYLVPAITKLAKEGIKVKLSDIVGCSYSESIRIKAESSVYFESIYTLGAYGNSGVEAMSRGIPVMGFISDMAIEQAGTEDYASPIIKLQPSVDDVYDKIKKMISGEINLHYVSEQSKGYCDKYHSYESVGGKLAQYIKNLCGK